MIRPSTIVTLVAVCAAVSSAGAAPGYNIDAPTTTLLQTVACRWVRERVQIGMQYKYIMRQECTNQAPATSGTGCRTEQQRIILPNGRMTYRTVNRCF